MRGSTARLLAALCLAGALVAPPGSAQASVSAPTRLGVFVTDLTVGVNTEGTYQRPVLTATASVLVTEQTITYDASDLAGHVTLVQEDSHGATCTSPSPTVLVCTGSYELHMSPEYPTTDLFPFRVRPTATAAAGASGRLRVTFEGNGVEPGTHEAGLRVGDTVDLSAYGESVQASGRAGRALLVPTPVRNVGESVAEGAVAVFYHPYAVAPRLSHRNCTYHEGRLLACRFDQSLAPGGRYAAPVLYTLRADTLAPSTVQMTFSWMTPAEYEDYLSFVRFNGGPVGTPGTGRPLALGRVADAAVRSGKPQVDVEPAGNIGDVVVHVTGRNPADLAADGAVVRGAAGAVVPMTVGLTNRGPATVDHTSDIVPVTTVTVSVPAGTTVVGVPDRCFREPWSEHDPRSNEPGAGTYYCDTGTFLGATTLERFRFELRIDRVVPNARGTVRINGGCLCPIFDADPKPANDVAKIVANPT